MNKNKALLAGAAMVALSMPLAQKEAKAASASISASAVVIAAINLAAVTGVHFGTMSITGAGTLTVSVGGAQGAGSGGISPVTGASAEQQGQFTILASNQAVDFGTNLPFNLGTPGFSMDEAYITGAGLNLSFTTAGAATLTGTPTGAATTAQTLNVGGRISSTGAVGAGTYSGSFQLTASYQ